MKCVKCKKEIPAGKGLYNRPDGIFCVKCNDKHPYRIDANNAIDHIAIAKKIFGL